MKIAIIGAGMSGLSCADALVAAGHVVLLFDKGRGPGGRMSTRRVDVPSGQACFDHGAQYFTVRDEGFARLVADWSQRGVAARWPEAGPDAWVGSPNMNSVIKHMASRHDVEFGFLAKALTRKDQNWQLVGESGLRGPFDSVIVASPAEQAASLLSLHDFQMARSALLARSQPCWTAMFAFRDTVPHGNAIFKNVGPIAWAARNNAKPGRSALETWVVQANATWTAAHLEESADVIAATLGRSLADAVAAPLPEIEYSTAHRWRYALSSGLAFGSLWNEDTAFGSMRRLAARSSRGMCMAFGPKSWLKISARVSTFRHEHQTSRRVSRWHSLIARQSLTDETGIFVDAIMGLSPPPLTGEGPISLPKNFGQPA